MSQTERKPKSEFQIKIQWFLLINIRNRTSIIKIVTHSRLHIQTYYRRQVKLHPGTRIYRTLPRFFPYSLVCRRLYPSSPHIIRFRISIHALLSHSSGRQIQIHPPFLPQAGLSSRESLRIVRIAVPYNYNLLPKKKDLTKDKYKKDRFLCRIFHSRHNKRTHRI